MTPRYPIIETFQIIENTCISESQIDIDTVKTSNEDWNQPNRQSENTSNQINKHLNPKKKLADFNTRLQKDHNLCCVFIIHSLAKEGKMHSKKAAAEELPLKSYATWLSHKYTNVPNCSFLFLKCAVIRL